MKKFNQFMEAVLVAKIIPVPSSDAVSPVEQCDACGDKPKDMFNAATDDFMKDMGFEGEEGGDRGRTTDDMLQPTDGVGEAGEIESEGSDGVELTCMGEEGLQIKFNGMTFTLPVNVVDAIKGFENTEGQEEGSTEEEHEEHEESESPAEEEAEHAEGGSEENESEQEDESDDEDGKKNPFTEAKKVNPWAVCTSSVGRNKKSKFESCVMDIKKKNKIKK